MPSQFIDQYLKDLAALGDTIDGEEFDEFISELGRAFHDEATIFIFGNGGCAVASSHFACDINKGVSYGKKKRFKIIEPPMAIKIPILPPTRLTVTASTTN